MTDEHNKSPPTLRIIPVNEPNGEGNGWDECTEAQATGFEIDDGNEVVEFAGTRAEAEAFIAKARGQS